MRVFVRSCVGVYDVTIHMQKWPHLEDHAKKAMSAVLVVHDIMVQNPIVFREVTQHAHTRPHPPVFCSFTVAADLPYCD